MKNRVLYQPANRPDDIPSGTYTGADGHPATAGDSHSPKNAGSGKNPSPAPQKKGSVAASIVLFVLATIAFTFFAIFAASAFPLLRVPEEGDVSRIALIVLLPVMLISGIACLPLAVAGAVVSLSAVRRGASGGCRTWHILSAVLCGLFAVLVVVGILLFFILAGGS